MLHHCCCVKISTRMKRWLVAIVGLQCLFLVAYLFFTHSPMDQEKRHPHSRRQLPQLTLNQTRVTSFKRTKQKAQQFLKRDPSKAGLPLVERNSIKKNKDPKLLDVNSRSILDIVPGNESVFKDKHDRVDVSSVRNGINHNRDTKLDSDELLGTISGSDKGLKYEPAKVDISVLRNSITHNDRDSEFPDGNAPKMLHDIPGKSIAHSNVTHSNRSQDLDVKVSKLRIPRKNLPEYKQDATSEHDPSHGILAQTAPISSKKQSVFMENRSASTQKEQYQKVQEAQPGSAGDLRTSEKWTSAWPPRGMTTKGAWLYKLKPRQSRQFSEDKLLKSAAFLAHDTFTKYTVHTGPNTTCMTYGTFLNNSTSRCNCQEGWTGVHCSIPDTVASSYSFKYSYSKPKLIDSHTPRRVINGFSFNIEWDMLETRMNELGLVVDLFVIVESNYSMYGEPKRLRLLERLRQGYLREFHHKIMYVFLDHFPEGGREDGWLAERYQRNYMSRQCLQRLHGHLPSDIFMFTDADEIPSFESVLFLKLHTGYTEPVGLYLAWSVYGFFWRNNNPTHIISACTMEFLSDVLQGDVQALRTSDYLVKYQEALTSYKKKYNRPSKRHSASTGVTEWYIGESDQKAGWHCSWCLPVEHIRVKLTSAINADFPRWGDYPSKLELSYIKNLVLTGMWFDDQSKIDKFVEFQNDTSFAPTYLLNHFKDYRSILDVKYVA